MRARIEFALLGSLAPDVLTERRSDQAGRVPFDSLARTRAGPPENDTYLKKEKRSQTMPPAPVEWNLTPLSLFIFLSFFGYDPGILFRCIGQDVLVIAEQMTEILASLASQGPLRFEARQREGGGE